MKIQDASTQPAHPRDRVGPLAIRRMTAGRTEASAAPPPETIWLIVEVAGQPSRSVSIDSAVLRVGSHSGCAVHLDECEPHALTVERRSQGCRVHNRTDRALTLADKPLEPQTAREWALGAALRLTPVVTLRLAPVPDDPHQDSAISGTSYHPDRGTGNGTGPGSRVHSLATLIPLVVLALTIWLSSRLFPVRTPIPAPRETDPFATMVLELRRLDDEGRYVAQQLQVGQQEVDLGEPGAARARWVRVRERIEQHRNRQGRFDRRLKVFETVLEWIGSRL
jgi:hypothetical protein